MTHARIERGFRFDPEPDAITNFEPDTLFRWDESETPPSNDVDENGPHFIYGYDRTPVDVNDLF